MATVHNRGYEYPVAVRTCEGNGLRYVKSFLV